MAATSSTRTSSTHTTTIGSLRRRRGTAAPPSVTEGAAISPSHEFPSSRSGSSECSSALVRIAPLQAVFPAPAPWPPGRNPHSQCCRHGLQLSLRCKLEGQGGPKRQQEAPPDV